MMASRARSGCCACPAALILWAVLAALGACPASAASLHAVPWAPYSVARGERAVRVIYEWPLCEPLPVASVSEGSRSVRVSLEAEEVSLALATPCSLPFGAASLLVPLLHPLAGRALLGASSGSGFSMRGGNAPVLVGGAEEREIPRVVGFSPPDARRALSLLGLSGRVVARRRGRGLLRVAAQSPAPGTARQPGMVVKLRLVGP